MSPIGLKEFRGWKNLTPSPVFQKIRIREIQIRKMRRIQYTDRDTQTFWPAYPAFKIFFIFNTFFIAIYRIFWNTAPGRYLLQKKRRHCEQRGARAAQKPLRVTSLGDCRQKCNNNSECQACSYLANSKYCYLKKSPGRTVCNNDNAIYSQKCETVSCPFS